MQQLVSGTSPSSDTVCHIHTPYGFFLRLETDDNGILPETCCYNSGIFLVFELTRRV